MGTGAVPNCRNGARLGEGREGGRMEGGSAAPTPSKAYGPHPGAHTDALTRTPPAVQNQSYTNPERAREREREIEKDPRRCLPFPPAHVHLCLESIP